ncbi:MAG: rod shape-determining protein [Lachnospiraceae bacterium]|nr:rod shape-determining protein [Lachnospiraceae bacterium]
MAGKVFAIDFGTSSLKIYRKDEGVIFNEKNIIAISDNKKICAIGDDAFEMYGKAPDNFSVTYPVKNGVIADIQNMLSLLNTAFSKISEKSGKITGADIIVASPTDITEVEKRAFFDLAASSCAKPKRVRVVEKPIANAVGAGLDVLNANGVMIVDIGADTTEISIVSLGGIVLSKLVRIGGNKFDDSIISNVRKTNNLIIGNKTAETIKKKLAYASDPQHDSLKVFGRNVMSGLPTEAEITTEFVYETLAENLHVIADAVHMILEKTPPEIAADIIDNGIYVTGGSANIRNIDKLFEKETELNVNIVPDPENTAVNGLGKMLEDPDKYDPLILSLRHTFYGG